MILKPIKSEFNQDFHDTIWKAKNYIRDHYDELKNLPNGKHLLDKEICEGAFINVTEYDNKDNPPWESHLKFVDVQIIFEGAEDFIIANTSTLKPTMPFSPNALTFANIFSPNKKITLKSIIIDLEIFRR